MLSRASLSVCDLCQLLRNLIVRVTNVYEAEKLAINYEFELTNAEASTRYTHCPETKTKRKWRSISLRHLNGLRYKVDLYFLFFNMSRIQTCHLKQLTHASLQTMGCVSKVN